MAVGIDRAEFYTSQPRSGLRLVAGDSIRRLKPTATHGVPLRGTQPDEGCQSLIFRPAGPARLYPPRAESCKAFFPLCQGGVKPPHSKAGGPANGQIPVSHFAGGNGMKSRHTAI